MEAKSTVMEAKSHNLPIYKLDTQESWWHSSSSWAEPENQESQWDGITTSSKASSLETQEEPMFQFWSVWRQEKTNVLAHALRQE